MDGLLCFGLLHSLPGLTDTLGVVPLAAQAPPSTPHSVEV